MVSLRPSINRLVTDGNTKLCGQGFVLVLFQSTIANNMKLKYYKALSYRK